ncbi:MAG: hypothetical protein D6748_15045 [Calditrichaeota bacterium]|nr:MAG: hypothetical protein D6748_15045 [Calditrichota bacterium]
MKRNLTYNYHKIFFRRPFWTELNRRFYYILFSTAVVIFSLTLLSIRYVNRIPEHKIKHQLKKIYISSITKYYPQPTANSSNHPTTTPLSQKHSAVREPLETHDTQFNYTHLIEESLSQIPSQSFHPDSIHSPVTMSNSRMEETFVDFIASSEASKVWVRNAIEEVPALITASTGRSKQTLREIQSPADDYQQALKELLQVEDQGIEIPMPTFTDFEVVKGWRDEEETFSIAHSNKKFVRYCIEKFYRNDPTVKGNIVVRFSIHPEGYVIPESIRIVHSDIPDERVLRCIKKNIRRWKNFPRVAYEMGEYSLTQKYVF